MRENTDREMIFKGMARLVFKVRKHVPMLACERWHRGRWASLIAVCLWAYQLHTYLTHECMGGIKTDRGINEGWGSTSRIRALARSLKSWCDDVARLCADTSMCLPWLWWFMGCYGEKGMRCGWVLQLWNQSLSHPHRIFELTWFSRKSENVLHLCTLWTEQGGVYYIHSSTNAMHSITF